MDRRILKTAAEGFGRGFSFDSLNLATVITIVAGVFLRLYLIGDQILLDDEWHSLHYVIDKNFGYLLTHFSIPGATSIPLNIYNLALLKTLGWSEFLLRLPSITAGILSLVIFPILVSPLIERRSAFLFTMLLALSPFLVFYSRVARPYSMVVTFGFASLMFGYNWLRTGSRSHCLVYLLTGALAVECHLFALPTAVAPLLTGALFMWRQQRRQVPLFAEVALSKADLAGSSVILAALLGLLQGPALLDTVRTSMSIVAGRDTMTLESAWNAACLLSGTAHPSLVVIFICLLLHGLRVMVRKSALAATLFVLALVINFALLFIAKPESVHAAIVIARYCIVIFPISFMLVATGLDDGLMWLEKMTRIGQPAFRDMLLRLLPVSIIAVLFTSGPWLQLYARPNNFTNHSVFQQSCRSIAWDRSFLSEMQPKGFKPDITIRQEEVSPFYQWLRTEKDAATIIEFPMMIGDHFNPYYYYQHFHKKRVLIGYDPGFPQLEQFVLGTVFGSTYVDEVLGRVSDLRKIKLRNMIDMTDTDMLARSGARYIVLHYRFEGELSQITVPHPRIGALIRLYEQTFGQPVYRDNHLVVYMSKTTQL